jgi:hypothetical protein
MRQYRCTRCNFCTGHYLKNGCLSLVLLLVLMLGAGPGHAQSIGDLITQLILDDRKLGDLKHTLTDMYKGYEIINKGYSTIRDIAKGNFNLHELYLDGLLAVSPAVASYPKVTGIIQAEYSIVSDYRTASRRWQADGHFTVSELNYISQTYSMLIQQSGKAIDELVMVLTAGELRMSDAERMGAIDGIYGDITGQLGFLRRFDTGVSVQAIQRLKAAGDIVTLRQLYGIGDYR